MKDKNCEEQNSTLNEAEDEAVSSMAGSIQAKYQELIMAVAQKFPNETRHETALRYIRQREENCNGSACESNV